MPDPQTAAPAAAPVAPDIQPSPAAAPDLSGLAGPGVAAPTQAQAVQTQIAPYEQAADAATQKATQLSQPTPPPAPVPHARLLAMIEGLGVGLSAAGASLGSHGREGGAPEVEQYYANKQNQKIQAQQAAEAQKNTQIQQQLTIADTNHKQAQNVILLSTLPQDLALKDLDLSTKQQELASGKASLANTQAEFMTTYGMTPDQFNGMMGGDKTADPATVKNLQAFSQQKVDAASKILPADDPYVQKAQQVLQDKDATSKDIFSAVASVNRQVGLHQQVTEAQTKAEADEANSPYGKLSTPQALADPGAQAAIQSQIDNPKNTPQERLRLQGLLPQAAVAQFNARQIKEREARTQQAITQGNPDDAGRLLATRALTLEELKSRQVTPQFIEKAVGSAQKYAKDNGLPVFNATEAAAQSKAAATPANQAFFGNTDSLLVKGGTLDQLEAAGKALGNTQIPKINTLENWRKAALGEGPQSAYAAKVLGVADDYSKVMSGGQGSDTSRQQAIDIISKDLSPEGRAAAIGAVRGSVESQRQGRVGINPYLKDMYPDPILSRYSVSDYPKPSTVSPQAVLMVVPGGEPHWIEPANRANAEKIGASEIK